MENKSSHLQRVNTLKRYHQKIKELSRFVSGHRVIEMILHPKESRRYYWKALITSERSGEYRVRLFDRFGRPYGPKPRPSIDSRESPLFESLVEAKIYARRTLLNQ